MFVQGRFRRPRAFVCTSRHGTIFRTRTRAAIVRSEFHRGCREETGTPRIPRRSSRDRDGQYEPVRRRPVRFRPPPHRNTGKSVEAPCFPSFPGMTCRRRTFPRQAQSLPGRLATHPFLPTTMYRSGSAPGRQCATPAATLSSMNRPSRNRSRLNGAARRPGSPLAISSAMAQPDPGIALKPPVPQPQLM